jgi:hypothetical protein
LAFLFGAALRAFRAGFFRGAAFFLAFFFGAAFFAFFAGFRLGAGAMGSAGIIGSGGGGGIMGSIMPGAPKPLSVRS